MKATYYRYDLKFKRPSGTSRGVLREKESWFLKLEKDGKKGIGECGLLRGLSIDDTPDYEETLKWVCHNIEKGPEELWEALNAYPSIQFGIEMAFRSLHSENPFLLFPSAFTQGAASIPINGLVWMGEADYMREQIIQKLDDGFRCIKLKIGGLDFETEMELLRFIRKEFTAKEVEIRVDANGAFSPSEALSKLQRLSELSLHSIEQPVKPGQWELMASLCEISPLPIALDEELIGTWGKTKKQELLKNIRPQYVILKPSLIGGFKGTEEWISLATSQNIGWWITSALESNVGLNAISQFTYQVYNDMPQGLGTGSLYTNNYDAPLNISNGELWYEPKKTWKINL